MMKNRNVNRQVYVSPEAGTVEMELRDLIAVSADGTKILAPIPANAEKGFMILKSKGE